MYIVNLEKCFNVVEFPLYVEWSTKHENCVFHKHNCTELVIVIGGTAQHLTKNAEARIEKGDVFVIPQNELHRYDNTDELYIINILFKMNRLPIPVLDAWRLPGFGPMFVTPENFFKENGPKPIMHLSDSEFNDILGIIDELSQESTGGCRFVITALFMRLIYKLSTAYHKVLSKKEQDVSNNIEKVIEYMHKHLPEKISAAKLRQVGAMSTRGLTRHFKKATGMSAVNYLIRLRVNEATRLLSNTQLSIVEIAERSGFGDSNYFCKAFTKLVGVSPSKYHKQNE